MSPVPTGSTAALADATVVNPSFVVDVAGIYVIELVVSDSIYNSVPDRISVYVDCVTAADAVPGDRSYEYSPADQVQGRYYWKIRAKDIFGAPTESVVAYFDYVP